MARCPVSGRDLVGHTADTCPKCLRVDRDAYLSQLTAVQARCTELLEESRAARRELVWKKALVAVLGNAVREREIQIAKWLRKWAFEAEQVDGPPQYEDALRDAARHIEDGEIGED